jgi:hypothetical protein
MTGYFSELERRLVAAASAELAEGAPRRLRPTRRLAALAIAAAMAAALSIPALAAVGLGPFARPTAQSISDELKGAFAALRRPATADDRLPPSAIDAIDDSAAGGHFGVNPQLARRVASNADETLYLVAGTDELCLVRVEDFGTNVGCGNAADALASNMVGGVEKTTTGWRVDGVLPDGVDQVTFIANDGHATAVPLANNVFSVKLDKITDVPAQITWTDPSGQPRERVLPTRQSLPP